MTEQHSFKSWRDFKGALPDLFGGSQPIMKRFAFRGQADADWPLSSSFDRAYVGADVDRQKSYIRYLNFFRVLNRRLGKDLPDDHEETGAIAQHYGMPTRLLDWSLSPYAAAFFAFYYAKVDRVRQSHVAVWALDAREFPKIADPRYFAVLRPRNTGNARIHRQVGSFIIARGEQFDLGAYLSQMPQSSPILHRCIIPTRDADEALNDLILMGQTPADIYPDFEGVAKYVRLRMAFEGYKL
ncbi:FRG domain-containing protein [Sphingosinicella sp. BN140058]|uniref:FRG domain-containing protein n=1 Tax=Sphingosinicella sp. BN140058 TaxID=1892855 RepID=UPI0010129043|nr:FRG domain-containing protein [Sphingosinicella sp. BN140058]QAY75587.1 FRG domain-containing protein [Sphingosinicella sp. BN140058]